MPVEKKKKKKKKQRLQNNTPYIKTKKQSSETKSSKTAPGAGRGKSSGSRKSKAGNSGSKTNPHRTRSGAISLKPLRDELEVLVNQANNRVHALIESGLPSRALLEAQRTWARQTSRANEDELFKSDLKSRRQIDREFARVHEFLNDYTSTVRGAKNLQSDFDRFSGHWKTGEDMDEKLRAKTFEIYRKVVEAAGGWERAIGLLQGKESLTGYGSENLVNNIYDMLENEYSEGLIIQIALEQVESGIKAYEEMAERQVSDYDYGIVFDDETAKERREFYTWRRRYRQEANE